MSKHLFFKAFYSVLLLLIGFGSNFSFAQNSGDEQIDAFMYQSKQAYYASNFDEAELEAQKGFDLSRKKGNLLGMGISLMNEALALMGKEKKVKFNRKQATEKLTESLTLFSSLNATTLRIKCLKYLKWIAYENKDPKLAQSYVKQIEILEKLLTADEKAGDLAEKSQDLSLKVDALNSKVTTLNKEQLQAELLIALQKNNVDSLKFQTARDSMMLFKNESILAEQKSEIALQKSQQRLFYAILAILAVFVLFMFARYKESKKNNEILALKNDIIQEEREKSEVLLLNILPSIIAKELKKDGEAQARKYDMATVFFSDFVNFSKIANTLSPEELVALLDEYFRLFDGIIEKHGLEKIKTIGDAYMCVGGLPEKNTSNPSDVILAALEIQLVMQKTMLDKKHANKPYFQARIGIHTGPVVAGVVGSKKFAFDIWGDTVNVASRLEANGEAGKVNISEATYEQVKNKFNFDFRGEIPIKNLGEIQMYFVDKKD